MASFQCFIQYVKQAQANSNFGVLSRGELTRVLLQNGMTKWEIDEALIALNELFAARVKQIRNKANKNQQRLIDAVYGGLQGNAFGLNPNEIRMMEDIATVME